MIKSLYIKNYAIIESLEIHFSNGLTIVTGETGAGKSILLGALGLIMGQRAELKALYNTTEKCVVEGRFDIKNYNLQAFFEENDLDHEPTLVIRREITPSGKSRAFINDTPTNLKVLQQISDALIDLHQQFDTLDIGSSGFQLKAIDALADNNSLVANYKRKYQQFKAIQTELEELRIANQRSASETEFLQFQLTELEEAALIVDEQEALEIEYAKLTNAEEIKRVLSGAFQYLSEDEQSIIGQLQQIGLSINQVQKFDPAIEKMNTRFDSAILELQDVIQELEVIAEATEHNPERNLEVKERLDLIYRLQNKHQVSSIEELLKKQQTLQTQLQSFEDLSANIIDLEKREAELKSNLQKQANQLSGRRKVVLESFEGAVKNRLGQLAMEHAQLKVQIEPMENLGPKGNDDIKFLFAANMGSRLEPIKEVASGGELSRLALVIKSLVASSIPLPTLIFDEIDSGISGDVALKMGFILRKLSDEHQVVTITHSPQVASKADAHYFVYKKVKDDRTVTKVRLLADDDRVRAIAVMLSQNPPSEHALKNARELIGMTV